MKAPKGSEPSKLFRGTAAKGSAAEVLVGTALVGFVSDGTTGSGFKKRSTVGGTGGD